MRRWRRSTKSLPTKRPAPAASSPALLGNQVVASSRAEPFLRRSEGSPADRYSRSRPSATTLNLILALEPVSSLTVQRDRLGYFQKCPGRVRTVCVFAVNQTQLTLDLQFADRNRHQLASRQLGFHADLRHQRHSVSHGDKLLNGLERGQLQVHVQRRLMRLELLNN